MPRLIVSIAAALCIATLAGGQPRPGAPGRTSLSTARRTPAAFGTDAYTVTTIPATAFYPGTSYVFYTTSPPDLGRTGFANTVTEFYAGLTLPGGAVVDYIGLNTSSPDDFAFGVALYGRHKDGSLTTIGTFSSTVHGWGTDFNAAALGYVWQGGSGGTLILNVEQGSIPDFSLFGWVEVWWRRSVSPPPATASFGDVPTSHPFFQFVEALKASGITGGCSASPPLYCPDSALTRGQMAVFLAKALGLNWPGY
ncbi:MAG: S-layer homology domain-containing protein [Syntrophomonadaceae bacterium]